MIDKIRSYLGAIRSPAVLGFYVLDAVITDEHLLAARVLINTVVEGISALAAVHAVA